MKEVEFKAGDLVYIPHYSNKILKLSDKPTGISMLYSFEGCKLFADIFPLDESGTVAEGGQVICHATQENYERLSATFTNIEFEPPPKRKEPKEIIKAMLKAGYDGVPCKTECGRDRYICTGILEGEFYSFQYDSDEDSAYSSGIPYHPKTGLKIVDFIDGKCFLENGEVVE